MSKRRKATFAGGQNERRRGTAVDKPGSAAADTNALKSAADAVVEACCLVAVVSVPLYFGVLTNTSFEPDKAVMVRVLATIAAAAWLIGFLSGHRQGSTEPNVNPLLWLGLFVVGAYCVATLLSIDPRLSFFGSQLRQEGLVTRAAYAVFFICAATRLRHRAQFERLITVLIFGSIPALLYGLFQQMGHDPLPSGGDFTTIMWPVRSTFGQHVFLGAYLIMVMPFTAARAFQYWNDRHIATTRGEGFEGLLAVLLVLFVALVFFIFVVLASHRLTLFAIFPAVLAGTGMLGVVLDQLPDTLGVRRLRQWGYAALFALQVIILAFTGARGAWIGFFAMVPVFGFLLAWRLHKKRIWQGVLGASIIGGVFLVVLNIPHGPLQPLRTVHGMNRLADITESGGTEVGSVKGRLLIWRGVVHLMTTTPAVGNKWGGIGRDVVGYGPESMRYAFDAVFPTKLRRATFEVWTWDRAHDIYLDDLLDAGLLGLLSVLAVVVLFFRQTLSSLIRSDEAASWLFIAMATAIAGHLVEGLFGLEMPVTLLLFWLIVGASIGLQRAPEEAALPEPRRRLALGSAAWYSGIVIVFAGLVALLFPHADHPAVLSTLWVISVAAGVAATAFILLPVGLPAARTAASRAIRAATPSMPDRSRYLVPLTVTALAAAVLLASQMQAVTAAIAEKNGNISYAQGDPAAALAYLEQASRSSGYEPLYRSELGILYRNLASGFTNTSHPTFRPSQGDVRSVDPTLALELGKDQLFGLSVAAFQSARDLAPLDPDLYDNLGQTYMRWKRAKEAIPSYQLAERLGVNNPKYLDDEALAQIAAGQPHQAVQRGLKASAIDNAYWYSHYALALAYHELGQRAQARAEASTSLFWVPVYSPPPPQWQIKKLHQLRRTG